MTKAYDEGYQDGYDGLDRNNHYPKGSYAWEQYEKGYDDGLEDWALDEE